VVALLLRINHSEQQPKEKFTEALQPWFDSLVVSVNGWVSYGLAREAAQQGYHGMAASIFSRLITKVCLSNVHFGLNSQLIKCL
jgi:hypothetical protein